MKNVRELQLSCLKPNDVSRDLALPEVIYDDRVWAIINGLEKAVEKRGGAVFAVFTSVPWQYQSHQINFLNYVAEMVVKTSRSGSYKVSGGMSHLREMLNNIQPSDQIRSQIDKVTRTFWPNMDLFHGLPENLWYEQTDHEAYCIRCSKGDVVKWVPDGRVIDGETMGFLKLEFKEPSIQHFCQVIHQLHRFPGEASFAK